MLRRLEVIQIGRYGCFQRDSASIDALLPRIQPEPRVKMNCSSSFVQEVWYTSELYISGAVSRTFGNRFHGIDGRSWCSLWYPTLHATRFNGP